MAEQQPPPPDQRAQQIAVILAGVVVAGAAANATAGAVTSTAAALAALTKLLLGWGWRRRTVRHTLRVTTTIVTRVQGTANVTVIGGGDGPAPALDQAIRDELTFGAWFLERTGTRVQEAIEAAVAAGEDADDAAERAEAAEARYEDAHERAQQGRREAAEAVDREAAKPGTVEVEPEPSPGPRNADGGTPGDPDGVLEARRPARKIVAWVAVNDDRVTPECLAADGCWFYADTPPVIGYPGQPHGATCRCVVGPATRAMFLRGRHVNEAVAPILEAGHRPHPSARPTDGRRRRPAA